MKVYRKIPALTLCKHSSVECIGLSSRGGIFVCDNVHEIVFDMFMWGSVHNYMVLSVAK